MSSRPLNSLTMASMASRTASYDVTLTEYALPVRRLGLVGLVGWASAAGYLHLTPYVFSISAARSTAFFCRTCQHLCITPSSVSSNKVVPESPILKEPLCCHREPAVSTHVAIIPDGNVGSSFGEALGYGQTNTGSSPRDDGRPALQGEERHHPVRIRRTRVVVGELAVLHVFCHVDPAVSPKFKKTRR